MTLRYTVRPASQGHKWPAGEPGRLGADDSPLGVTQRNAAAHSKRDLVHNRWMPKSQSGSTEWTGLTQKPTAYPAAVHSKTPQIPHAIHKVIHRTGLAALA